MVHRHDWLKHPFTTFYWYLLVAIRDVLTSIFGSKESIYQGPTTKVCVVAEAVPHLREVILDKPLCTF